MDSWRLLKNILRFHKHDTLPQYCRECEVRFACHGECPKNRFINTPDGEPGLNYLCAGYKAFFNHIDLPMRIMADLLRPSCPGGNYETVRIGRCHAGSRFRWHRAQQPMPLRQWAQIQTVPWRACRNFSKERAMKRTIVVLIGLEAPLLGLPVHWRQDRRGPRISKTPARPPRRSPVRHR
jgi:hypothetical protein